MLTDFSLKYNVHALNQFGFLTVFDSINTLDDFIKTLDSDLQAAPENVRKTWSSGDVNNENEI